MAVHRDYLVKRGREVEDGRDLSSDGASVAAINAYQTYRVFAILAITSNESQILDFLRDMLKWPQVLKDMWGYLTAIFSLYLGEYWAALVKSLQHYCVDQYIESWTGFEGRLLVRRNRSCKCT